MKPVIGCLGAGRMGRGIAVVFAFAGHQVVVVDFKEREASAFEALAAEARAEIRSTLEILSRIDLLDYAASLATLLGRSFGAADRGIRLSTQGDPVPVTIETAVPCGLILNELISNAIKYKKEKLDPVIKIKAEKIPASQIKTELISPAKNYWKISITDNGIGFDAQYSNPGCFQD